MLFASAILAFFLLPSPREAVAAASRLESDRDGGAPETPKAQAKAKSKAGAQGPRPHDPPGFYMGRPIADVMSWQGADWLFRETRVEEEQPEAMLDALKIPRGATVADVGAGAGYHSIRLARRVGPKGTVYATDVQPEMLRMLADQRPARPASPTSSPSAAPRTTPSSPRGQVDLIMMVDVYHECSDPELTLQGPQEAARSPAAGSSSSSSGAKTPKSPSSPSTR